MSTKSKKEHTHRELCDIAVRWLKRSLSSGGPAVSFLSLKYKADGMGKLLMLSVFASVHSRHLKVMVHIW